MQLTDEERERRREYNHQYYVANRKKIDKRAREWAAAHPEKELERVRRWQAANPERARANGRRSYANNREQEVADSIRWAKANPEKVRATKQRRRARKAGNGGSYTDREWLALCAQYNNQCVGPGPHGGNLEPDHVIPVSKPGGTSYIENIQPLCHRCNCRKGTKTIDYRT